MNLNGLKVLPSAIEDVLALHPDIRDVTAFAVHSKLHGAIPAAAIVLTSGAERSDPEHFVDYCRSRLGIRGPRQVVILDEIPRNAAGKPLRRDLGSL